MMRKGDIGINMQWMQHMKHTVYDSLKDKRYVHLHTQDDI
jgi:hypothetical protein